MKISFEQSKKLSNTTELEKKRLVVQKILSLLVSQSEFVDTFVMDGNNDFKSPIKDLSPICMNINSNVYAINLLLQRTICFSNECLMLSRSVIEKVINLCYLLTSPPKELDAYLKHGLAHSYSSRSQVFKSGEHIIRLVRSDYIRPNKASNDIKVAFEAFEKNGGGLLNNWTDKKREQMIDLIPKSFIDKNLFHFAHSYIYDQASQSIHGTNYGCLSFTGIFENGFTNGIELETNLHSKAFMTLFCMSYSINQVIKCLYHKEKSLSVELPELLRTYEKFNKQTINLLYEFVRETKEEK